MQRTPVMSDIFQNPEQLLATTMQILKSEGLNEAAELLRAAHSKFDYATAQAWERGRTPISSGD